MTEETRTSTLPKFNGEQENYEFWMFKFKAYAVSNSFDQSLSLDPDLPEKEKAEVDMETTIGKKQLLAVMRNKKALSALAQSFSVPSLTHYVTTTQTLDWPSGQTHVVMEALREEYQPDDFVAAVESKHKIAKITMKKNDNPKVLVDQMRSIKTQYLGSKHVQISDVDIIAVLVEKVPNEYKTFITTELTRDDGKGSLKTIETKLKAHWRTLNITNGFSSTNAESSKKSEDSNEQEVTLFAGTCFKCKKPGHKSSECKSTKFKGNCTNCGKVGHKETDCWLKEENASKRPSNWKNRSNNNEVGATMVQTSTRVEMLLSHVGCVEVAPTLHALESQDIWIADTGATVHITPHDMGVIDKKTSEGSGLMVGNGENIKIESIGNIKGIICDKKGMETSTVVLQDVAISPGGKFNLFSVSKLQRQGWKLYGDEKMMRLTKDKFELTFDIVIDTAKGRLFGMLIKRTTETAQAVTDTTKVSLPLQVIHGRLGHINEDECRSIAHTMGWTIHKGGMPVCVACTTAKARQKNLPKHLEQASAPEPNGRVFMDTATVKVPQDVKVTISQPNWHITVDDRTGLKISRFAATKDGMVEPTCNWLKKQEQVGRSVKIIRQDNAGENKSLVAKMQTDFHLYPTIEWTARNTPQQNSKAEVGIATIAQKARAMLIHANIPEGPNYKLFPEAVKTATLLDGLTVITLDGKKATRFEHWGGSIPEFAYHLRTFGEAGTVTIRETFKGKVKARGIPCIMTGYAIGHPADCYRMVDPKTMRVYESRDVTFLKRMFYEKPATTKEIEVGIMIEGPVLSVEATIEAQDNPTENSRAGESIATEVEAPVNEVTKTPSEAPNPAVAIAEAPNPVETETWTTVTKSGRASVLPTRFREVGNIALCIEDNYYAALNELGEEEDEESDLEVALVGAGIGGGFQHTSELKAIKYKQAIESEDSDSWQVAVEEEHKKMVKQDVFKAVPKSELPEDAKILSSTWAMKKKASGVYRARVTARGYEQVKGVHYDETETAAPVVQDSTVLIVLIMMILARWKGEVVDVVGAFLYGTFNPALPKIYMHVPQGFERFYDAAMVLLLQKTLYGLIQAAYAFWQQLTRAMMRIGYKRSNADACLHFKWTEEGLNVWTSHVDDCLNIGSDAMITKAKQLLSEQFECDEGGEFNEYLGCKIQYNMEDGMIKFTQPVLWQSLVDEFDVPEGLVPRTPAVPDSMLVKSENDTLLDEEATRKYRKLVGKAIHLTKTRPDLRNAVRELAKFMQKPTIKAQIALNRLHKYCVGTPNRGFILKPTGRWDGKDRNFEFEIRGRSDSEYAKDSETRKSVMGYVTYVQDTPVTTKSKMQNIVALSVTEAEIIAAVDCVQEMISHKRLIESLDLKVKLPMLLEMDNKGATDLFANWNCGGRTRHIDVRYYFVRDLKEAGILKVQWIPSANNTADLFTKNLAGTLFDKHAEAFCGIDEYMHSKISSIESEGESVGIDYGNDYGSGSDTIAMRSEDMKLGLDKQGIVDDKEIRGSSLEDHSTDMMARESPEEEDRKESPVPTWISRVEDKH